MLNPREYQRDATNAIVAELHKPNAHPLADLATGAGKSLIVAMLVSELPSVFRTNNKILMLAPSKELVRQNYQDALEYNPMLRIGVYCAGLNRKEYEQPIVYGTINSIENKPTAFGVVDYIIIDEAHKVNTKDIGRYRKFINKMRDVNPDLRVIGLTATPYRLDGGMLTDPIEGIPLFTKLVYTFGLAEAIVDGYLVPLKVFQQTKAFDDTKVSKVGGDFNRKSLEQQWTAEKVEVAVQNLMRALTDEARSRNGERRKHILAFCCGIQNAKDVALEASKYGLVAEHISGEMNKNERDDIIERFKAGEINLLTNADILTTGFNAKNCDCIAQFRNTLSTSLYVQMLGRGTRTFGVNLDCVNSAEERRHLIATSAKPDCLVLDFTSNTVRHGPVEDVSGVDAKVQTGTVRARICSECEGINKLSAKVCVYCGTPFPEPKGKECPVEECGTRNMQNAVTCVGCGYDFNKHEDLPYDRIKDQHWHKVEHVKITSYKKKYGFKPPIMRVEYFNSEGEMIVTEWVSFDPSAKPFALKKGRKWWTDNGGSRDFPLCVIEAVERGKTEIKFPTFVALEENHNGYMEIRDKRYDTPWVVEEQRKSESVPEAFVIEHSKLSADPALASLGL